MDPTQSKHSSEEEDMHLNEWLEKELQALPAPKHKTPMSTNLLIYKASLVRLTDEELIYSFTGLVKEIDKLKVTKSNTDYITAKYVLLLKELLRRLTEF